MSGSEENGMSPVEEDALIDQASEWFLRLRSEDADADRMSRFRVWLNENPAHELAYMQVQDAWTRMDDFAAIPELMAARGAALERAHQAREKRLTSFPMRKFAAIAAVLALLVASVPVALHLLSAGQQTALAYETGLGESRVITLSDNSSVSLDTQSRIKVVYTSTHRTVELLEGQAFFDVAKNPARPFEVVARGQKVVALGTAFNVNMEDNRLSVTLVEGHVSVSGEDPRENGSGEGPKTYRLSPGEKLVIDGSGSVQFLTGVNLNSITAWRQGKLVFEDEPLSEAIGQMNRHSRIKINVEDKGISSIAVSGVFNAGDTDAFVQALELYFSVRAVRPEPSRIDLYASK